MYIQKEVLFFSFERMHCSLFVGSIGCVYIFAEHSVILSSIDIFAVVGTLCCNILIFVRAYILVI